MKTLCRFALIIAIAGVVAGCGVSESEAEQSLRSGHRAFRQKAFHDALRHFRISVAQAPSSADAHTWRGYVAALLGEFDEALEAYQIAARLEPSPVNSYRVGALADRMGKVNLAVESLKVSLSFSWLSRTLASLKTGFSGSFPCLKELLEVSLSRTFTCVLVSLSNSISDFLRNRPEQVAQHIFRVLVEEGDHNGAVEVARSRGWVRGEVDYCIRPSFVRISSETSALLAMLLHPERAGCLVSVGMDLTKDGLVRLARLVLLTYIRNSTNRQLKEEAETFLRYRLPAYDVKKQAESLNIVGYNLQYTYKKPQEAIKTYQKAIALEPLFSWPYNNIGLVYRKAKENDRAIEWYQKAVAVNPNHWKAHRNLGRLLLRLKRYEDSLVSYRQAADLNPNDGDSQYKIGWILSKLRRYDEALVAYRQAVALNPDRALSHWGLSWALSKLGEEIEAKQEWEKALQLDPNLDKKR